MDLANLEKMKVVDLRNELQSRGLDYKGVKAILIERLRAHLEGSGDPSVVAPPSPCTPGRRSRRTRSMTRSPSPLADKKIAEPLEALTEEGNNDALMQEANNDALMEEGNNDAEKINDNDEEQKNVNPILETPEKLEEEEHLPDKISEIENKSQDFENEKVLEGRADNDIQAEKSNIVEEVVGVKLEVAKSNSDQTEATEISDLSEKNEKEENAEVRNSQMKSPTSEVRDETLKIEAKMEISEKDQAYQSQARERSRSRSPVGDGTFENEEQKENSEKGKSNKTHVRERSRSGSTVRDETLKIEKPKENSEKEQDYKSPVRDRSRSRSRSRSKTRSKSPKHPSKTVEEASTPEDEPSIEDKQYGLSWFDSDLHIRIDPVTFASAKPINQEIYALVWSGARANYGVQEGKVCFEVRISEETNIGRDHAFRDEPFTKGFRVGFSTVSSNLLLGESENSFAYCESGKKAVNGEFKEFSKPFQLDDVIGCYLDLDTTPCSIKYTLNGEDVGVAFEFDKSGLGEDPTLFPHILTKGYEYQVNFADNENLLVNLERKVRKKRKPFVTVEPKKNHDKEEIVQPVVEKEQNDEENWDEDPTAESEKSKSVESKPLNEEVDGDGLDAKISKDVVTDDQVDKNDVSTKSEEKIDVSEKKSEEKIDVSEKLDDSVKNVELSENEHMEVESKHEDKKEEEDKKPETLTEDTKDKVDVVTEEDCRPSPSKRQKIEAADGEDEFEEIHPIPRPQMELLSGFELIALVPEESLIPGPQRPESRKECEVILMVGLPGSGKTTWVLNHLKENPDKRYDVIGPDALISKMTVDGAPRKSVHKGRFDHIYELCFHVLTSLEDIAIKRRRNFILDQANVYASAQRRKMKGFGDFKRKAIVCIPNEEELKRRLEDKKEKGNAYTIKESILHGLQANFTLPSLEFGWFDEIVFTDLSGDEAKEEVKKYNEKGKKESNREKRPRRDNHSNDNRRRYDDRRRYENRNENRWNDRRGVGSGGGGGGGGYHGGGGNRWSSGGGGGGGGYRAAGGGFRDDRGYGGGGGGGGRGYDQRRYSSGPQNWTQNNRNNRFEDRSGSRYGTGSSGNRYDSYSGGGGSRDYRGGGNDNRDHRDRHRGGSGGASSGGVSGGSRRDNPRTGGSSNQRDFRHGHRDTREDSRGGHGSSKVAPTLSNYNTNAASASGGQVHDKYNKHITNPHPSNKFIPYQQTQTQSNSWPQYNVQQQNAAAGQQYWNYDMQNYAANQQWQTMDPQQQQQWMSWWQQQGGNAADAPDPNQYWSQYCYTSSEPSTEAAKK